MLLNALPPKSVQGVSSAEVERPCRKGHRAVSSLHELFSDLTSGSDARVLNSVSGASVSCGGRGLNEVSVPF